MYILLTAVVGMGPIYPIYLSSVFPNTPIQDCCLKFYMATLNCSCLNIPFQQMFEFLQILLHNLLMLISRLQQGKLNQTTADNE